MLPLNSTPPTDMASSSQRLLAALLHIVRPGGRVVLVAPASEAPSNWDCTGWGLILCAREVGLVFSPKPSDPMLG